MFDEEVEGVVSYQAMKEETQVESFLQPESRKNKSARIQDPGGSPETGLKKPGDEEKPLKADSSAPESKEAPLKGGEE